MTSFERRRHGGLAIVLVLAAGCGRVRPAGLDLVRQVAAGRFTVAGEVKRVAGVELSFATSPHAALVDVDHERRPAVVTGAGGWTWHGRVPEHAQLHVGLALLPGAAAARRFEAVAEIESGGEREVLAVGRGHTRPFPTWVDLAADLTRFQGREVTLRLRCALAGAPSAASPSSVLAWGPATVAAPAASSGRPNVLMIVVDTLRRDRLTPYHYFRETSPEVARWIGRPGTVIEHAYSQAPWTLPSVVSFMTGRYPGELLLGGDMASYGIPPHVLTLAERLAAIGYETGGYLGNPSLHVGAGFERGFRSYYAPPADVEWLFRHADDLNRHAVPWLAAHQDRPFFLYVHYIDPHDPYDNPEIVGNRSPFEAPYTGPVAGGWVNGIYSGKIQLTDPARDIAHLSALYDSEVHYVDRAIGELMATFDPAVLANTLVVFTADHGEELHDHGGWKHGQTLYDEQVHVPLLFRWDRHVAAGRSLAGTVRLVDLVPTIMAAVGAPVPTTADAAGIDLLPALTGRARLPELPAFAQGLVFGPLRAAATMGGFKLLLFNRSEPTHPDNPLEEYLCRLDLGRLARSELYDLREDPGEHHPLAGHLAELHALDAFIERRLDGAVAGLRVQACDLPPGSRLSADVVFTRPPGTLVPHFLGDRDRIQLEGRRLHLELVGDGLDKGVRVQGETGGLETVDLRLDGRTLPANRIVLGQATPYRGGAVATASLLAKTWPAGAEPGPPILRIWFHAPGQETPLPHDAETERSLRALGYIH